MLLVELFEDNTTGHTIDAYHGTKGSFDAFKIQGGHGAGSRESPIGIWFTDSPAAAEGFADFARGLHGANIMPVRLKIQHPLVLEKYRDLMDMVDRFTSFQKTGYIVDGRNIRMMGDRVDYEGLRQHLRDEGYDGIILKGILTDSPDGKTPIDQYIVLSPNQVRSRFAKFSAAKTDSEHLMDSTDR